MNPYNDWAFQALKQNIPAPTTFPAISWPTDTKYGRLVNHAMMDVECILATDLIAELDQQGVRGAVVEFGVFEGYWMEKLIEIVEAAGSRRQVRRRAPAAG